MRRSCTLHGSVGARCGLCTSCVPLNNGCAVLELTHSSGWFLPLRNAVGNATHTAHVLNCTAAWLLCPASTCSLADFLHSALTWWLLLLVHESILSCLVFVCLSALQFLSVCLFVDEGAEDKVGPLEHCPGCGPAASREWRKQLAPSISVSVPEDEPYHSDEEYYEHPLFSSEWTGSCTHPSATVKSTEVLLGHDEGELSMVPFCCSSPLPTCHPFHSMCPGIASFWGGKT